MLVAQRRGQFCYCDRKMRIVMRQRRAVQLSILEFAIFNALHSLDRRGNKTMTGEAIYEEMYRGCANPAGRNIISQVVRQANAKLAHLGIKIAGANRREHSFYRLVLL